MSMSRRALERNHLLQIPFIAPSRTHIRVVSPKDFHAFFGHLVITFKVELDNNKIGTQFLPYKFCNRVHTMSKK